MRVRCSTPILANSNYLWGGCQAYEMTITHVVRFACFIHFSVYSKPPVMCVNLVECGVMDLGKLVVANQRRLVVTVGLGLG